MMGARVEKSDLRDAFSVDDWLVEIEAAAKVLKLGEDMPEEISRLLEQLMDLAKSKESSSNSFGAHIFGGIIMWQYERTMDELAESLNLPSPEAVNYVLGTVSKAVPVLRAHVYSNPLTKDEITEIQSTRMPAPPILESQREGD